MIFQYGPLSIPKLSAIDRPVLPGPGSQILVQGAPDSEPLDASVVGVSWVDDADGGMSFSMDIYVDGPGVADLQSWIAAGGVVGVRLKEGHDGDKVDQ
jgi:hypothetical protein